MIVVIAAAVVSVFLHTETDQIAGKNAKFLASNWEFLGGNWEKRRIFWIGNGGRISDTGDREKRPWFVSKNVIILLFFRLNMCFGCSKN